MYFVLSPPSSPFLIFSGGMPRASYGDRHCISIIHSKTHEALDFTSRIIDFFVLREGENHRGRERCSQTHDFGSFTCFFFSTYTSNLICATVGSLPLSGLNVCLCHRWAERSYGFGGGGAGRGGSADWGVARHPDALPGAITLFSHHLLAPRLRHPAQTVGESASCGSTAEYTLLQEGMTPYAHTF